MYRGLGSRISLFGSSVVVVVDGGAGVVEAQTSVIKTSSEKAGVEETGELVVPVVSSVEQSTTGETVDVSSIIGVAGVEVKAGEVEYVDSEVVVEGDIVVAGARVVVVVVVVD